MVNPSSRSVGAAHFGEFRRTDKISSFGVTILGVSADKEGDLKIDADNQGEILRLALDDAMRKILPDIDRLLASRARGAPTAK